MWWNDIKIILFALALFIVPYIILLLIIAVPESTPIIIVSVILLCILIKALINVISKLIYDISYSIRQMKYAKQEKKAINEINQLKQKWINDLRNGKSVLMGNVMIQCENEFFKINGERFYIKEIQGIDITCKILWVFEKKINTKITSYKGVTLDENLDGFLGRFPTYSPENTFGKVLSTQTLTEEEYHEKMKSMFNQYAYGDQSFFHNHRYEFEKEYYISISFYNGNSKLCPIGRETDNNNLCPIPREARERFIEIERCINELKTKN